MKNAQNMSEEIGSIRQNIKTVLTNIVSTL